MIHPFVRIFMTIACLHFSASYSMADPGQMALNPTPTQRLQHLSEPHIINAACCKTCRKGKACGDSCISRNKTCRKSSGFACDG
ncbi:hypothetical protein PEL8287_00522 [Roseovarius litorisediminis]|uniref:Uncharacterized protein n=1 Tax=Roseovarius litorisediminis TaxID=1312363 RepID=A0A1Y5RBC3_9RHOB|nr:hypothetical protein PEL8287_00522 [Roseovarius litorisediminis]